MVTRTSILARVIDRANGDLSPDLAKYILALGFSEADQARYLELSEKAQEGILTAAERAELEEFLSVNNFLIVVQTKARVLLHQAPAA